MIWNKPAYVRPANAGAAVAVPAIMMVGSVTRDNGVVIGLPSGAAGFVTPNPVPYRTIVSPGAAGAAPVVVLAGPISEPSACVATMCVPSPCRKKAGATSCTWTVTAALARPRL